VKGTNVTSIKRPWVGGRGGGWGYSMYFAMYPSIQRVDNNWFDQCY